MAAVNLTRTVDGLAGSVGERQVDLMLDVPNSRAGIHGRTLGADVDGYWRVESNAETLDPVGLFLGEYDDSPVFLRSEVHLTPSYALRHADLTGAVGDHELRARIAPVEAPAFGPSVVGVDGQFDGKVITLFVAVESDLSGARVDGVIDGQQIKIVASHASISGDYAGPAALFPLIVGALLYFL